MQLLHSVPGWSLGCRDVPVSVEGFLQVAPQIVSWQGISCMVPQGRSGQQRKILHSISGVAAVTGEDGQLMPCLFAVLGPSGAGKTTFMDILSGRKQDPGTLGKCTFVKILLGCKQNRGNWQNHLSSTFCLAANDSQVSLAKPPFVVTLWAGIVTDVRMAVWQA